MVLRYLLNFFPKQSFRSCLLMCFLFLITEINEQKLLSVNSLGSQFTRLPVCEWWNGLKTEYVYIFQMVSNVFFNYRLHKDWIGIFKIFFLHVILNLILLFLNMLKAFKTLRAFLVSFTCDSSFTVTFCFSVCVLQGSPGSPGVTGPSGKPGKPGDHGRPVSGWLACLVIPLWVMKRLQDCGIFMLSLP